MESFIVDKNEAKQRLDKLLMKRLNLAPKSFIYKMLRKKNITLNGKKADGREILQINDEIKLFLSDETIDKFTKQIQTTIVEQEFQVVYEDEQILIVNKPVGLLSQKASGNDISLVDQIISYLLKTNQITKKQLQTFKPAICNRLDRNTSGLVVAGKTLRSLQVISDLFKKQKINKYYLCIVVGNISRKEKISGFLKKDEKTNHVFISKNQSENSTLIKTEYEPIRSNKDYTLLKIKLITGKSHQIRAHLASIGHPILGDYKYGNKKINELLKNKYKLSSQLLHSYELEFPEEINEFQYLSCKKFQAKIPDLFQKIEKGEKLCRIGIQEDLEAPL
jgi:23S rRNA pseudouridine955/2504/2580 synthase